MSRPFWILFVSGLGMIVGGMALLFVSGYDALNADVWSYSWIIVRDDPGSLISASLGGEDANLYRGLTFVFGGMFVLLTAAAVVVLTMMISGLKGLFKSSGPREDKPKKVKEPKAKKSFDFAKLKAKISDLLKKDPVVELEADEGSAKKVISIDESKGTKRVKMKRPFKEEMAEMFADWMKRLRELKSGEQMERKDTLIFKEAEKATKSSEFHNLTDWYEDVQKGSEDASVLVARAQKICGSWGDADFGEYASKDPINGAFIVRLVKSWADRESLDAEVPRATAEPETLTKRERDREAMRAAMRALKNGESLEVEGEAEVDLDEVDATEELLEIENEVDAEVEADPEELEDDMAAMMAAASANMKGSEEEGDASDDTTETGGEQEESPASTPDEDSQSDDEDGLDSDTKDVIGLVSEMRSYVSLLKEVQSGEGEWPEELSDDERRSTHVTAISSAFEVMTMVLDEEVIDIAERLKDNYDELDWLSENQGILESGFVNFVESLEGGMGEEDPDEDLVDDGDQGDDEAADVADPEPAEEVYEVAETASDETAMEDALAALEGSEGGDPDEDGEDVSGLDLGGEPEADEAQISDESAEIEGQDTDAETSNEASEEIVETAGVPEGSDPENEQSEESSSDEKIDEPQGEDGNDETSEPVEEVEVEEPKDLTLPILEELEASGDLPTTWGRNCREAGATEFQISRVISVKSDGRFKPVGIVQLLAIWKTHSSIKRVNVFLRKVPEGEWSLKFDKAIRMENERGDFVEVSEEILGHKEVETAKTIVQFYGEGVEEFEPVSVGDDKLVLSKTFSVEEIQEFIRK